jgi:hypothetical protein
MDMNRDESMCGNVYHMYNNTTDLEAWAATVHPAWYLRGKAPNV